MHRAERCPASRIFNNEVFSTMIGVWVVHNSVSCATVNLYKIWKAAHIGIRASK